MSSRPVQANIHPHHEDTVQEEEEFYNQPNPMVFDFDFSTPNNSNPSFFDDYSTSFDFGFDLNSETENLGCEYEDPNCFFFGGEEDDEQMNFVTDLFEPRHPHVTEDLIWELESGRVEDPSPEFGFGPGLMSNIGLRVVGMDSESDSEEFEVNAGFVSNDDDIYDRFGISSNIYRATENEREEFEWEEISERIQYDERENLNVVINRIEEISVTSDISSNTSLGNDDEEVVEAERNIEWEVLLAMNNLERALEFENPDEINNSGGEIPHANLPEDYILTMEYDALFGQLVDNENASKGSPPAAKSVVENLPSVVLTKEEIAENNNTVVCAVCKDEFAVGEKVTKMPCCHLYHRDCIIPWLGIRNTCPVCRYELPTDDANYEKRRSGSGGGGGGGSNGSLVDDFEVRYNFELLP